MHLKVSNTSTGIMLNKNIQGQFSEHLGRGIYEGLWVGKDSSIPNKNGIRVDAVEALKNIKVPILRWPGGLFADEYDWKDGIGNPKNRRLIVNNWWGGTTEDNSFGTHEFMELCEQINCDPYINANVGSGTIKNMADWIEYMTAREGSSFSNLRSKNGHPEPWSLKYLGIGNENWGCGGNMRPEYYSDLYKQFQTFVRDNQKEPFKKVACGPNVDDFNWTDVVMKETAPFIDALSLHFYATTGIMWEDKGDAVNFEEKEWNSLLHNARRMDYLITQHSRIMDRYDPNKRVELVVDEWGTWFEKEEGSVTGHLYQQNTMLDAVVVALTMNIFYKHADRVKMANIAQMVNVLQAMILTKDDQMILTPTYYAFDLYKHHQDAELIESYHDIGDDVTYTISQKNDEYIISATNMSSKENNEIDLDLSGTLGKVSFSNWLHSDTMNAHNTFENPESIQLSEYKDFSLKNNTLSIPLPKMSIITIKVPFK